MAGKIPLIDLDQIKSRITIPEILTHYSIPYNRNRCKCPVHSGNNPTSFAFNDDSFYCHSCGVKGDVIQLIRDLEQSSFQDAVLIAARVAGFKVETGTVNIPPSNIKITPKKTDPETERFKMRLGILESLQHDLSDELRVLNRKIISGKISLSEYYLQRQVCDHNLHEFDQEIISLTHRIKLRKGK